MNRQQGFSMLELMVAMALGLLISAAAIQLFLANQVSLNFQRGMNDVQANGRFAIDQVVHDVRLAGLGATATGAPVASIVFAAADLPGLDSASTAVTSDANALAGLLSDSDQLVLQYFAMVDSIDCEGNTVAAGRYVVARYFIRLDENNVSALACDGSSHDGAALETASGKGYGDDGVILLSGVDSFQVQYGVDDKAVDGATNGVARIARYVDATTFKTYAPAPTVLAVRLGVYAHSAEAAGDVQRPANDIQVLDVLIDKDDVPSDRFMRRLFISTVSLRNIDLKGV